MLRLLLASSLVALAATAAAAAPLAPTKPSDVRMVYQNTQTPCPSGGNARLVTKTYAADGTIIPFSVPAKQVFVVTQVDWFIDGATAAQAATLELLMFTPDNTQIYLMVDGATPDGGGRIRKTTLTSPLIVPSGNTMCAGASSGAVGAFVHGFLTKAK